ncbi:MAG: LPXTG cell wall anchor domain-containing protein [Microbacterium sp.]
MGIPRAPRVLAAAASVGILVALAITGPAAAVPPDQVGVYPTWGVSGSSGAYTATPGFPASSGFPALTVTSTATSVTSPTGASNYYNAASAFGTEFGSSRNQPYLLISTAASQSPSTTTLEFAADPPAGWGFALGDIDADWVFIQAYADAARTQPLTVAQLGFEGAGNSCLGSPRPSACSAPGLTFESPTWVTATEFFDGITYQPPTLRGSIASAPGVTLDTAGAYGWFRPTVPVRSIVLLFGPRAGFPTYTLTLATPTPKVTITGTVTPPAGQPVPPGTAIAVAESDGTPVLDLEGQQLSVPVAADGTFTIEAEQRDAYLLDPVVPPGYVDLPPFLVPADTATAVAPPIVVVAAPVVPPTDPDPDPDPDPAVVAVEDPDRLAASGADDDVTAPLVAGLALLGAGVLLVTRRRSPASRA